MNKNLKIFAYPIDPKARAQIDLLLAQEPFKDCKVRIMPDVHAGVGCVIGFTANLGDKVIPNIVGVDIGCGMLTVNLGKQDVDLSALDRYIRENIPSGRSVRATEYEAAQAMIDQLYCCDDLRDIPRLRASLGTLGGGNHFIEIDVDDEGNKYLIIHTGSRNLGKQVAEIYQDLAVKTLHSQADTRKALIDRLKAEGRESEIEEALRTLKAPKIPRDLCWLEGQNREYYLHDMRICQDFALVNRHWIADSILAFLGLPISGLMAHFHTIHNYIDSGGMVRKGAISAKLGEPVLIPINMRDGCILGHGLGNPDWNESAPHGAGRIMSRSQAKESIPIEDYRAAMDGIYTTSVSRATLDEAPQAYKPLDNILGWISPTVEVEKILKPVYSFKAAD